MLGYNYNMQSLGNHIIKYKSQKGLNKASMMLLALLPILAWYKIPLSIGLGYAFVLPLFVFTIVRSGFKINVVPATFWIVFIYVSLMWMYNNGFSTWTLFPPGGGVFFIFTLSVLWGILTFDLQLLKKYMRWIVIISGVLFWIQLMFVVVMGSPMICFVPNLTGAFIYEDFTYSDIVAKHLSGMLPCSIFLEKSYLAYYFLTYLALLLFNDRERKRIITKEIVFVTVTLIASQSGTAMVGLSALIVVKMFNMFWTGNTRRRFIQVMIMIPIAVGAVYTYVDTDMGQSMLSRTEELSKEGTSGYTRVMAGYFMFATLTPEEKTCGISDASNRFGMETSDGRFIFYTNGIQSILINLGYVGLILYFVFYASVFRKVNLTSRMCIIVLLIMSLLEANYLNPYMILLTVIPCAETYKQERILL